MLHLLVIIQSMSYFNEAPLKIPAYILPSLIFVLFTKSESYLASRLTQIKHHNELFRLRAAIARCFCRDNAKISVRYFRPGKKKMPATPHRDVINGETVGVKNRTKRLWKKLKFRSLS